MYTYVTELNSIRIMELPMLQFHLPLIYELKVYKIYISTKHFHQDTIISRKHTHTHNHIHIHIKTFTQTHIATHSHIVAYTHSYKHIVKLLYHTNIYTRTVIHTKTFTQKKIVTYSHSHILIIVTYTFTQTYT